MKTEGLARRCLRNPLDKTNPVQIIEIDTRALKGNFDRMRQS